MKVAGAKKIPRSTMKNMELAIAPNLVLNAQYSLLVSKTNLSTLRTQAFTRGLEVSASELRSDELRAFTHSEVSQGEALMDHLGMPIMTDLLKESVYSDQLSTEVEVEPANRAKAYRYGGDYITTNAYDEEALKMPSKISMRVLGFVERSSVPRGALIDSGYAVTGGISPRAQIAISALANALEVDGMVGVARFVKVEDDDPVVGILFPMKVDLAEVSHSKS